MRRKGGRSISKKRGGGGSKEVGGYKGEGKKYTKMYTDAVSNNGDTNAPSSAGEDIVNGNDEPGSRVVVHADEGW